MKLRRRLSNAGRHRRNALAPVELVLSLPIWLLLVSAMVIVGNLGAWKIRGHLAVREAAARSQWPRTRMGESNPTEWSRPSAGMQVLPRSEISNSDFLAGHTAVRGPQLTSPASTTALGVDSAIMQTTSSAIVGEAFLNEPPPLWPRSGVRSRYFREFPILDGNCGQWSTRQSGESRAPRLWNPFLVE